MNQSGAWGGIFATPIFLPMIIEVHEYADKKYINYEGHSFELANGVQVGTKTYIRIDSFRTLIVTPTENPDYVDANVSIEC